MRRKHGALRKCPTSLHGPPSFLHLRASSATILPRTIAPSMASTRIASPMRGGIYQLSRLPIRQDAIPVSPSSRARRVGANCSPEIIIDLLRPLHNNLCFISSHCFDDYYLRQRICSREALGRADSPRDNPQVPFARTPPPRIISRNPSLPPYETRYPTSRRNL